MVNATHVTALKLLLTCSYEGDHIFGLLPLLASRLNGAGGTVDDVDDPRAHESKDQKVSRLC
jgi:ribonuclease Z